MDYRLVKCNMLLVVVLYCLVQPVFADSRFGSLTHIRDPEMQGLPGQWIRPHPGPFIWGRIEGTPGEYDWKRSDKIVRNAQQRNQTILATIWPYADWEQQSCNRRQTRSPFGKRFPRYLSKPCSMGAYFEFLQKVVDRYDGDNKNDMPGLAKPIRHWEIMNEPEFDMFFNGSQEDFIEIFITSSKLIRKLQPQAVIVMAGAAGMFRESERYWNKVLPSIKEHFDIATVHHIAMPDGGCDRDLWVGEFSQLLNKHSIQKPIWVTEAQPTTRCGVVDSYITAFSKGADIIFSVGVRAPGPKMAAKDRQALHRLMTEYDLFTSISVDISGNAEFLFEDGSKKLIMLKGRQQKSSQKSVYTGRD